MGQKSLLFGRRGGYVALAGVAPSSEGGVNTDGVQARSGI